MFTLPHTPIGPLWGETNAAGALTALHWGTPPQGLHAEPHPAATQLEEYFAGTRTTFTIPLAPQGTPYQQKVWKGLCTIPFGKTLTYAQLAQKVGTHARPLGGANGKNPIPILIPCHRVVAAQGLGGYSGAGGGENGLRVKSILLTHENKATPHA